MNVYNNFRSQNTEQTMKQGGAKSRLVPSRGANDGGKDQHAGMMAGRMSNQDHL